MMQERQNEDFTDPAKPKDTDISSASTSESGVHNNDSNSDNDDDISESEDSLQEEAVLPETDRINSLILQMIVSTCRVHDSTVTPKYTKLKRVSMAM